ncbi:MAG: 2-dehydropantoate 2-reductase [Armatimonadota bacterium]|nr:2-dehydropantoate 2-reductase [Armatimonadota bacterium]
MELTIVGAGAVGGVIGAHLARAGHRVQLIDRNRDHVEAIQRHGLHVGGVVDFTVHVPACLPDEAAGPIHTIILAVKTLHTREALAPLVPALSPDGCVVSMQNGLEEPKVAALVGWPRTVGAFLTFGAYYEGPGRLVYSGPASLRVGEPDGRITPRVLALAGVLSDFHPTEPTDNIWGFLWGKLILGTIYFATATVDADVTEILARDENRRVLAELATEACQVADALGVRVESVDGFNPHAVRTDAMASPTAADAAWAAQVAYWQRGTARRAGVWRDLAIHHRKTEAEPILGALIEAALRAGRPVPRVRALLRIIGELEGGRRRMGWANLWEIARAGPGSSTRLPG